MAEEKPLLEYQSFSLPPSLSEISIRLYEDGRVETRDKEKRISPEQVSAYADRLVQAGFFDFDDVYKSPFKMLDGSSESMTLNYQERSKTIVCKNRRPPSKEFGKVIAELEELVEE